MMAISSLSEVPRPLPTLSTFRPRSARPPASKPPRGRRRRDNRARRSPSPRWSRAARRAGGSGRRV
jgi:hypothetical protein